jgi:type 1 glutamine amidotransferase
MNVRELITELEKIENKDLPVVWRDRYGMGGDCCSTEEYHYHYDYNEPSLEDVDSVYESMRESSRKMVRGRIEITSVPCVVVGDY